jgi:ParB family chromosome partitioning protein
MKPALGKGLGALLPGKGDEVAQIEVERVIPNEYQPRRTFRDESLQELAASIREKGVLQPVIVSRVGDGSFRLIAGERRWRAASLAGLKKIPALVKDVSSQDAIEIALIENIQREDLNPVETAAAFQRLLRDFHLTQEDLSQRVGKDRATISNYLRLLKLPDEVKALLNESRLSMGHAKALLSLEKKEQQLDCARAIVRKGLSVRESESLCQRLLRPPSKGKTKEKLPEVIDIEDRLTRSLGTKVRVYHRDKRGRIEIEYYSLDELDRLIDIFEKR